MALDLGTLNYTISADTKSVDQASKRVKKQTSGMTAAFKKLGPVIAGAFSIETARRVLIMADNFRDLRRSVDQFTDSTQQTDKVMDNLVQTSNRSGMAIESVVKGFQSFTAQTQGSLDSTQDQMLQFIRTLNEMGQIAGMQGGELESVFDSISESLSGDTVDVGPLNETMNKMPVLARQLSQHLGVSVSQIREMAKEGELMSQDVFGAVLDSSKEINETLDNTASSMSDGINEMRNGLMQLSTAFNESTGASHKIVESMQLIANLMSSAAESADSLNSKKEEERSTTEKILHLIQTNGKESLTLGQTYDAIVTTLNDWLGNEEKITDEKQKQVKFTKDQRREMKAHLDNLINSGMSAMGVENPDFGGAVDRMAKEESLTEKQREERAKRQRNLEKHFASEQELIDDQYQEWLRTIENATNKSEQWRQDQLRRLEEWKNQEQERMNQRRGGGIIDGPSIEFEGATDQLKSEEESIREAYQKRRDIINEEEQVSEELRQKWLRRNEDVTMEQLQQVNEMQNEAHKSQLTLSAIAMNQALSSISNLNNTLLSEMERAGKEQTAMYKSLFYAQRAIQVVQIIANTLTGASQAINQFGVYGVPIAAAIEASGYAQAGIVAGLTVGGRQAGGDTFPNSMHRINEGGTPEMLEQNGKQFLLTGSQSGRITSTKDMQVKNGGGDGVRVNIINEGKALEVEQHTYSKGEVNVLVRNAENKAVGRVDSSLASGGGSTSRALQNGFKVTRNVK